MFGAAEVTAAPGTQELKTMRILLTTRRVIEENRNPIALLDLAAFLRARGHSVNCYFLDQLSENSGEPEERYDLVGLSVLQVIDETVPAADALYLKTRYGAKVVVGGKWTETIPDEQRAVLLGHGIDICVGPGEEYFHPGEIDFKNYPPWDEIDLKTLKVVRPEVMSARGCPYRCNFCHNTENRISFFSASRTASNIELLLRLGSDRIFIVDDIFTLRQSHMSDLYAELKAKGVNIERKVSFFSHVNHLTPGILEQIAVYKPAHVQLGIESGDDRMLKAMGKPFTSEEAFNKLRLLDSRGICVYALFLVGFPEETEESLQRTLRFIEKIEPFIEGAWMSYYQPVRGTKGYLMAAERAKDLNQSKRNTDVTYVDPNLTAEMLIKYRTAMVKVFSRRSLKGFIRRGLIRTFHRVINRIP